VDPNQIITLPNGDAKGTAAPGREKNIPDETNPLGSIPPGSTARRPIDLGGRGGRQTIVEVLFRNFPGRIHAGQYTPGFSNAPDRFEPCQAQSAAGGLEQVSSGTVEQVKEAEPASGPTPSLRLDCSPAVSWP
jgi:hypothetical protein